MSSYNLELSANLPVLLTEQQKHVDAINRLTEHSDLLLLVYGPKGAGKTLLAHHICCDQDNSICLTAEQVTGLDELLDVLAQAWQLDLPDNLKAARQFIVEQVNQQETSLTAIKLLIDDAHLLDAKLLKSIAQLALDAAPLLALILFGEADFSKKLQTRWRKLPLYIYELTPLSLSDCKALFIQENLDLSDDELQTLYQVSDSWAGSLLTAAQKALAITDYNFNQDEYTNMTQDNLTAPETDNANDTEVEEKSTTFGRKHIFALAGLAILLILMLFYSQNYQSSNTQEIDLSLANTPQEQASTDNGTEAKDYNYAQEAETKIEQEKENKEAANLEVIDLRENQGAKTTTEAATAIPESSAAVNMADSSKLPTSKINKITKPQQVAKATTKPVTTKIEKTQIAQAQKGVLIQLFGSYKLAAAKKFKRTLTSRQNAKIYQTKRNQRTWYLVVLSGYANKAQARNAITSLPVNLKAQKPWIRSAKGLTLISQ